MVIILDENSQREALSLILGLATLCLKFVSCVLSLNLMGGSATLASNTVKQILLYYSMCCILKFMSTGEWDLFYLFKVHTHVQNKGHYQMLKGQYFYFRKGKKYDCFSISTSVFLLLSAVCNGLGTGELTNTMSINATNIESFRNCTKINGNIGIIRTSIHG